jgi:AcrR family transcriptional regulator
MPKNLSAAEVDAFRARLCAVAQHLFAKHGRDGVSMRQLADALGCSAMTPYRYFRNKDAILAAVRTAAFERFAAALEAATRKAEGDLRAQGAAVGETYIGFALREPEAYRLMFDLSQPHPDRYPELVRASARARELMSASTKRLVEAGVFQGDPVLLGHVFWATMHGLVVLQLAGKLQGKPDFRTIYGEAMRLLIAGARSGAAAPAPPAAAPMPAPRAVARRRRGTSATG